MATKLIPLPETQRLSSRVIRILGGNPGKFTLQGTNTYIIGTGPQRILVDTGEGRPSWIKAIREVLIKENAQCHVILTHKHVDHIGGIRQLLELYPETMVYKYNPSQGQRDIKDGQIFKVDGATLRAIHTPGHTTDHVALVLIEEDAMFTGDNVLGQGTAVFEDLAAYIGSLEKMKSLFSGKAYPGHGPVIDNGKERIVEYIKHRQQREEQVLEILKSKKFSRSSPKDKAPDNWDSMEIVKIIYKEVSEELHIPAHGGVIQVLWKLQQEDKVTQDFSTKKWRINAKAAL